MKGDTKQATTCTFWLKQSLTFVFYTWPILKKSEKEILKVKQWEVIYYFVKRQCELQQAGKKTKAE